MIRLGIVLRVEKVLQISHIQTILNSHQALRVLAGAYKILSIVLEKISSLKSLIMLIFTGLILGIDPERPEAAEAVRVWLRKRISVRLWLQDHQDTAEAIVPNVWESLTQTIQKVTF